MYDDLILTRPTILQDRKHFINCAQYLICSYIEAHKIPFHWIFLNNWGGIYHSCSKSFSISGEPESNIFNDSLANFYHITKTTYSESLRNVISDRSREKGYLFIKVNARHIPWHYAFQKEDMSHLVIIKDIIIDNKVLVIDWVPEYFGWVDYDLINQSYLSVGSYTFMLSKPSLNITKNIVANSLKNTYQKIKVGLVSLHAFIEDIRTFNTSDTTYLQRWWDELKSVIDQKEALLELLYYLRIRDTNYIQVSEELISTVNNTISAWNTLRNGFMKSLFQGNYDIQRIRDRTNNIIKLEELTSRLIMESLSVE